MRFIVYGAGAVGGVVGAGLVREGYEVVLIARGDHGATIAAKGLTLTDPTGVRTLSISVVAHPRECTFTDDDVVLLATKSQDTLEALTELSKVAPVTTTVVCVQNGVENERVALRFFSNVYGICVVGGTAYLEPGAVMAESGPIFGSLDIGRYPEGIDDRCREISAALSGSWVMFPRERVMEWKYTKMLRNIVLAVQALCGANMRQGKFFDLARAEGEACLRAAGIPFVDDATWAEARIGGPEVPLPPGGRTIGGSSWQSLARGTGSIESAYINGEILLLSRVYGVAAPANELLYELGVTAAATGQAPGTMSEEELFTLLAARNSTRA